MGLLHLCKEVRTEGVNTEEAGTGRGEEAKEGGAFCLRGSKEVVRTLPRNKQWESTW